MYRVRDRQVWYKGKVITITSDEYQELQKSMFMHIWRETFHVCYVSNVRIYEALSYNFHHVLEKRNYELYALCKWNIVLLDKRIHDMYETKSDTVPVLVELKNTLITNIETNGYKFDNDFIWKRGGRNHLPGIFDGFPVKANNKRYH